MALRKHNLTFIFQNLNLGKNQNIKSNNVELFTEQVQIKSKRTARTCIHNCLLQPFRQDY